MKRLSILFLTCLILPSLLSMKQAKDRTILFFGDSITQQASDPEGFIRILEKALADKSDPTVLINKGIGGNKVTDLYLRLPEDVLANNPDEVMIWVGINDVWHRDSGTGTDLNKFPGFYQKIIDQLKERNIKVTLCTPGVIGERKDEANPHDKLLNEFSAAIRTLAEKNNVGLIDFRKEFQAYEAKHNTANESKGILTTDGVHLNAKGNQLVAEAIQAGFKL